MDIKVIILFLFLTIAIITNVLVFSKFIKKYDQEVSDDSVIQAQVMLIDRKINDIREDIQDINEKIENNVPQEIIEVDELSSYVKNGVKINEIAKKMNKSVKEIELMLKMRGLM